MTPDPVTELEIEAYVDGELDPVRRLAVEDHLSRHADAATQVMADLRARSALRLAFQEGSPIPAAITAAADPLRQRLGRQRWRLPAFIGLGAAASMAALAFTAYGSVPAYVGDAVMSHRVGLIRAAMTSQLESPRLDAREVMRSTDIRVPVLPQGWWITDVQLFPADSGPALQVMIRTDTGDVVSMFALRTGSHETTEPVAVQRDGIAVAYWNRNGMAYALTGAMPPADIDRAADDLADNQLS